MILKAIAEGSTVYLLLDDGRILAKEEENKQCAEVSIEQMMRLQIPAWKLVSWFGWRVEEEAP